MAGWMNGAVLAANKGIGWMGIGNSWVAKQMGQVPRHMAGKIQQSAVKNFPIGSEARKTAFDASRSLSSLSRWAGKNPKKTTLGTAGAAWWALGD